jgi:hypothetical protein
MLNSNPTFEPVNSGGGNPIFDWAQNQGGNPALEWGANQGNGGGGQGGQGGQGGFPTVDMFLVNGKNGIFPYPFGLPLPPPCP